MKVLKIIWFYISYIFYVAITQQDRHHYAMGKIKGYDCIGSHDDSRVLYGSARMYYYDKKSPPTKHYVTFKEYKSINYPV